MVSSFSARIIWVAALVLALLASCAPIVKRHGFVPTDGDLAQLVPGRTTRAQALEVLPPPTMQGAAAGSDLYYVSSRFETLGPLRPRETDRQVVAINVNGAGIVTGVTRYGLADGRIVPLSQRVTDDNITNLGFLRQLMGNLGRVDPSALFGGR